MDFFTSRCPDKLDLTVTFAQSLDGKLAGPNGSQIALSCQASMQMTHKLRSMHDAILVGANTAINDNPQLNTRLLPAEDQRNPQPVVLDTNLRLAPTCKLIQNYAAGTGQQPWLLTSGSNDPDWHQRKHRLEGAGARILIYEPTGISHIDDVSSILAVLSANGIASLMVEGGPTVIQSFIAAHLKRGPIVDRIIITIAPVFVGENGMGYQLPISDGETPFAYKRTLVAGSDTIVLLDCTTPVK